MLMEVVNSSGTAWDDAKIVTMDRLGHATGTFENFSFPGGLEASGRELYFGLGEYAFYRNAEAAQYQGIYRVSKMHGSETSLVYDSGEDGSIDDIIYDINNGILYANIKGQITALTPDSSGMLTVSRTLGSHSIWTVSGNPADSSSGNNVTPSPQNQSQNTPLPSAVIEPAGELSQDVMNRLASLVSIDASELHLITQENISSPKEPTQSMKQYIHDDGYEAAYKLNTLTVSNDGYYVFAVNIPDELVGMKVSDVKLYALKNSDFASSKVNSSLEENSCCWLPSGRYSLQRVSRKNYSSNSRIRLLTLWNRCISSLRCVPHCNSIQEKNYSIQEKIILLRKNNPPALKTGGNFLLITHAAYRNFIMHSSYRFRKYRRN